MTVNHAWLVRLEFGRVQQFIFEGTELKMMIGANALLGEVLRGQLGSTGFDHNNSLPGLIASTAQLPPDIDVEHLGFDKPDQHDPLKGDDRDDPEQAYRKGVLARDGGHFHAVFLIKDDARNCIRKANRLLRTQLPNLRFTASIAQLDRTNKGWELAKPESAGDEHEPGETPFDVPQQQVCQATGQGPASLEREYPGGVPKRISALANAKRTKAEKFDSGQTHDVIGLLRNPILHELGHPDKKDIFPNEFDKLAAVSNYVAVIAADGNGIGTWSSHFVDKPEPTSDYFQREARREKFFYRMRVAVRRAIVDALRSVFKKPPRKTLPFRLLMLGGDDILIVCDAVFAMPLVVKIVEELDKYQIADDKPLHLGIGVAIVKKSFPFHRSHALAEQLAASAKRLYRMLPEESRGSTVDWLAISEAWHDEIADVRQRDAVRRFIHDGKEQTLVLSRKPYRVLTEKIAATGPTDTLQGLLDQARIAATQGERGRLARGQLIALVETLKQGRLQADWALQMVPDEVRNHLRGVLCKGDGRVSVWHESPEAPVATTSLMDFLELVELERLQLDAAEEKAKSKEGPTHA